MRSPTGAKWTDIAIVGVQKEGSDAVVTLDAFTGPCDYWDRREYDLTDFAGSSIRIVFHILSDQFKAIDTEEMDGWYVDDVHVFTASGDDDPEGQGVDAAVSLESPR